MTGYPETLTINGKRLTYKELQHTARQTARDDQVPDWERKVYRFIAEWLGNAEHIIQFSSGTTGKSKRISLPKQSMTASAENTCRFFDLKKGDAALLCLPVDYIAAKMMIVRSFVGGLNLLIREPRGIPDLSGPDSIDFCAMVPYQVMQSMAAHNHLDPVKKLIIGGAEISRELDMRLQNITTEVFATYGMAETCSHVAVRRVNGPFAEREYQALPGVDLEKDDRGCLVIRASYLPLPVVTNDLVEFTGPGSFKWMGRLDNLINSGGIKIIPEELENLVAEKTGLFCTCTGAPDPKLGQKLVMVFEKSTSHTTSTKLKAMLQDLLPVHYQPRHILHVDTIPRNMSMKVDRLRLSEMVNDMLKKI
jgi:O-succinylbenzoic acid--CoA ligase